MKSLQSIVAIWACLVVCGSTCAVDEPGYRWWSLASGDNIPWPRKIVGIEGTRVRLEREDDHGVDAFELAELADDEQRFVELWRDPQKRPAVDRVVELGRIEMLAAGGMEVWVNNWRATDDDLRMFVKAFPQTTLLSLSSSRITQDGLQALPALKQLRSLRTELISGESHPGVRNIEVDLSGKRKGDGEEDESRVVDPGFSIIAQVKSLEELEFHGNGSASFGKHWEALAGTKLKRLKLDNARLSAADLQRIAKIETLEYFEPGVGFLSTGIKPPLLQHLGGIKQLHGLNLDCRLTDEDAKHLANLPHLRELHVRGWTHQGFAELAKLKEMKTLRLLDSFDGTTNNDDLKQIGKLERLKVLWISSNKITDDGLEHIAGLTHLEELYLPEAITPKGLCNLEKMTRLKKLNFSDIFDEHIKEPVLASHALDLLVNRQGRDSREALHILGNNHINNFRGYTSLGQNMPKVDLSAMQQFATAFDELETYGVTEEHLTEWLEALAPLKRLQHFTIEGTRNDRKEIRNRVSVQRSHIEQMAKWRQLNELEFDRCDFAAEALQPLGGLKLLKSIELVNCGLSPGNLQGIGGIDSLKTLTIYGSKVPADEIAAIGKLANLEELNVSLPLQPKALTKLKGLKKLKKLEFCREGIRFADVLRVLTTDWGRSRRDAAQMILSVSKQGPAGQVLSLQWDNVLYGPLIRLGTISENGEFAMTNDDLAILSEFPEVESLTLPSGISDEGMRHVGKLKNLRSLSFPNSLKKGSKLTDVGTPHLASLSELRHLNLSNSELTDAGMLPLAKLAKLESLSIEESRLSDEGLATLSALPELVELKFNGSEVTTKGLDALVKSPKLQRVDLGLRPRAKLEEIRRAYPRIGFNGLIPFADKGL